MSRTIDEKVVEMKFDNSNFESNVKTSMSTLDKLKNSLKLTESATAFKNLDKAVKEVRFDSLNKGIDEVKARLSGLDMIANTVISRITNSVIDVGTKIATAIPNQIKSGGWRRATNIDKAKFQLKGLKVEWDDIKDDIDYAVSGTAYGLDAAANAAAQLKASNVALGHEMKTALRGISGVAAMTNSTYEEISPIFTSIAGMGKVTAMQLNMIANRGLNAKAAMAEYFNSINSGEKTATESIKTQVKEITKGLKITEGDISDFVSKGVINFELFSEAMDDAFGEHAKAANETYEGSLANIKSALSRIGEPFAASYRKNMIGPFNEIRLAINKINKTLEPLSKMFDHVMTNIGEKLANIFKTFNTYMDNGGSETTLYTISTLLVGIVARLNTLKKAWNNVFNKDGADGIYNLGQSFAELSRKLMPTETELKALEYVFTGVFKAVEILGKGLKILLTIIAVIGPKLVPVITVLTSLLLVAKAVGFVKSKLSALAPVLGGVVKLFGAFSRVLLVVGAIAGAGIGIYQLVKNFDKIKEFFKEFVKPNVENFFNNIKKSLSDWYNNLAKSHPLLHSFLSIIKGFGEVAIAAFQKLGNYIKNLPAIFGKGTWQNVFSNIGESLSNFAEKISGKQLVKHVKTLDDSVKKNAKSVTDLNSKSKLTAEQYKKLKDYAIAYKDANEEVRKTNEGVSKANEEQTESMKEVVSGIKEQKNAADEATKSFDMNKLVLATMVGSLLTVSLGISRATYGFGQLASSASRYIDTFSIKKLFGISIRKVHTALMDFAVVIAALAGSLLLLSGIDSNKLKDTAIVLGALVAVTGVFAALIQGLSGKFGGGSFNQLTHLTIGVAILVGALMLLDKVNVQNIWPKVGVIAAMIGVLATVEIAVSRWSGTKKITRMTFNILALAIGLYAISKVLNNINDITGSPEQIQAKIIGLIAVVGSLALFAMAAGNVRITSGIGLLLIVYAFKNFSAEIDELAKTINPNTIEYVLETVEKYQKGVITLAGVIGGIIVTLGIAGKGINKMGLGFLFFASGFGVMGLALSYILNVITQYSGKGVLDKAALFLLGIGVLFTAITAFSTFGKGFERGRYAAKIGAMMLLIASSFIVMGLALSTIAAVISNSKEDEAAIWKAFGILVAVFALSTLLAYVGTKATDGIKMGAMVAMLFGIAGVVAAVGALAYLTKQIGTDALLTVALVLGTLFFILSFLFHNIAKVTSTFNVSSTFQMLGLAAALAAVGAMITIVATLGKSENMGLVIASVSGIAGVIVVLTILFHNLSRMPYDMSLEDKMKGLAKVLLALSPLFAAVTLISVFGHSWNFSVLIAAGAVIAGLVLEFSAIFKWIAGAAISEYQVTAFVHAALALIPLVAGFTGIAIFANPDSIYDIIASAVAMGILIAEISGILYLMSKLSEDKISKAVAASFGIVIASFAMIEVAAALSVATKALEGIDSGSAWQAFGELIILFAGVATVMGLLGVFVDGFEVLEIVGIAAAIDIAAASMIEISAALLVMSNAAKSLGSEDFKNINETLTKWMIVMSVIVGIAGLLGAAGIGVAAGAAALMIAGAFALLGLAVLEVGQAAAIGGEGLIKMAKALELFIPSLEQLSSVMSFDVFGSLLGLAIGLGALGVAGTVCLLGAAGIAAFGQAVSGSLVGALEALSRVTRNTIEKFGENVIYLTTILAKTLDILGPYTLGIIGLGVGFLFFGWGIEKAGAGIQSASNGLSILLPILETLQTGNMTNAANALSVLAWGLLDLAAAGFSLGFGATGLQTAANCLPSIISAMNSVGLSTEDDLKKFSLLAEGMNKVAGAAMSLNLNYVAIVGLGSGLMSTAKALKEMPSLKDWPDLLKSIDIWGKVMGSIIPLGELMYKSAGGIAAMGNALQTMAVGLANAATNFERIDAVLTSMTRLDNILDTSDMLEEFYKYGSGIPEQICEGIKVTIGQCQAAGEGIGENIITGIENKLGGYSVSINVDQTSTGETNEGNVKKSGLEIDKLQKARVKAKESALNYKKGISEGINDPSVDPVADVDKLHTKISDVTESNKTKLYTKSKENGEAINNGIKDSINSSAAEISVSNSMNNIQNGIAVRKDALTQVTADTVGTVPMTVSNIAQQALPGLFQTGGSFMGNLGQGFVNTAQQYMPTLTNTIVMVKDNITGAFGGPWDFSSLEGFIASMAGVVNEGMGDIYSDAYAWVDGILELVGMGNREVLRLTGELGQLKSEYKKATNTADQAKLYSQINQTEHKIRKTKEEIYGTGDAANKTSEEINGLGDGLDNLCKSAGGAGEAMNSLTDTIANQMDIFEEFNMKTELTGEQLLNNMRSQIQGVSQWASNMQELAMRGMAPGLYKKLMDLGPQGFEKVNAFMQMSAEQLAEANQLYATSLTLPGYAAKQVEGSYGYAAEMANAGFINGIDQQGWYQATYDAAAKAEAGSEERLEIMSPSHVMFRQGEYTMMGFNNGLKAQMPFVESTIRTIANKVITTMDTFFKDPANSVRMGQAIMQGFISGMNTLAMQGGFNGQTIATSLLSVFTYELGYGTLTEFVQGMLDFITQSFFPEDSENGYMYDLVQDIIDNIKLWFEENGEDFITYITDNLLTPITDEIDAKLGMEAMTTIGENIVNGLIQGIKNKQDDAVAAATELGEKVNAAFKSVEREASPSKVFYGFGKFLDMGLANGIRAYTNLPVDAVSRMGDTINTIASRVSSAIDGSMDMSPVIRPVLDTTNISNGIGIMNSMFGSAQARVSATATGYAEAMRLKAAQLELSKNAQNKLNASYANALVDAVNSISNTDTNVNVVLAGDAAGVFKLVRTENSKFVKSTGYAPLAQRR